MAVANNCEHGRIAILYNHMANLTVYLLKVANLRTVDRHLRYPGKIAKTPRCQVTMSKQSRAAGVRGSALGRPM